MVTSLKKWSAGTLVLFMLMGVPRVVQAQQGARQPTETEKIAQCVDNAANAFADCAAGASFWMQGACAIKYAADAIFCIPTRAMPSKM
mgnify:CR=1 FL=1